MNQNKSYITLDSVIKDYLLESDQSQNKYFKIFHLAFRGFEWMGMNNFYNIRSVKLPINDNFTVTIPADYMKWTKVGVLNGKGEVIPLYYNDKLTNFADLSKTRLEQTQDDKLWVYQPNVWSNYWNGSSYINVYGYPSGAPFVGSFKVDEANGIFLLDEKFKYNYLMVEYMASPVEGQEYYLPVQFREALIAWLWWKDKRTVSTAKGQVGIQMGLKSEFHNQLRLAKAAWKPIRIQEMYQSSQELTRLTIRS